MAAHRRIGEHTGRLHTAGRLRRIVLLIMCAIVVALAVQLVSAGALLRP